MKKYTFGLLLAVCAATSVLAQAPSAAAAAVGVVESVEGLVTVSQGNTLGNLVKDSTLVDGARVVTTSTGAASIRLTNKCRIDLSANQAVTIDSRLECKALVAGIQSTGAGVAAAASGGGAIFTAASVGVLTLGLIASQNSSGS